MLQDPCEVCRSAATCRLKLNCSRYLRYQEALRQQDEDEVNLRRCRGIAKTTPEFMSGAFRKSNEKAAREHPWIPAEEVPKTTTLPEPAQEEENIMNENVTISPAVEAAKRAMQRVVDLQKLRSEKDTPVVRGLFIDLSTRLLNDELMAAELEGGNE